MTRTEFLREQTVTGANKCKRAPMPCFSVTDATCSIAERKALALKLIFENMPVYIGEMELIVGTRTYFAPNEGNEDGHDNFQYGLFNQIPYLTEEEIKLFGKDDSYFNKTHYTPDFSIILDKGVGGIINEAEERKKDSSLSKLNIDFLQSVIIAYNGLKTLILRYAFGVPSNLFDVLVFTAPFVE